MNLVAVTACPSGVAHTYLAAESLEIAANELNTSIFVETQGSIGIENELTEEQIKNADCVILTNNISIKGEERFKNKPIVRVSAAQCINQAPSIIKQISEKINKGEQK